MIKHTIFLMLAVIFGTAVSILARKADYLIDADTGNEMDDLYAITRMLPDSSVNVIGLTSAHFNNVQLLTDSLWHIYPTKNINTVQISQELNARILKYLSMEAIPHPPGCDRMLGYAWGFYPGAPIPDSPATRFIIEKARMASPENKLNIICLGAVTNVAAAILVEPGIISNIRLYLLSMHFDEAKNAWNKNEFNARNDLNGLDVVLNAENLELIVMPASVSGVLIFNRRETLDFLGKIKHPLSSLLARRWDDVRAGETWVMWDLALVTAVLNPGLAVTRQILTPPENTQHQITVYTAIDAAAMRENFWVTCSQFLFKGVREQAK